MNIVDTFSNRLKNAMEIRNMKQSELVEKTSLDKTLISKYLSGITKAGQKKITLLANALNVNEIWLMGYDVPMNAEISFDNLDIMQKTSKTITVPIYGVIPAGIPISCIQELIDTEEINIDGITSDKQYFGLKIKGDSMFPEYLDNDIIILEQVNDCESGDDCVVMVNGNDGTFKRVFKNENGIVLQPLNNSYEPMIFSNKQIKQLPVKVIGKVIELRRKK